MRKLVISLGIAAIAVAGTVDVAHADGKPKVAYAAHGKVKQQAYWAKSYNHPHVIICVTKGDKSKAVYKIAQFAKKNRKMGYYWGGLAGKKYDRLCNG